MASWFLQPDVGVVGAKLLYPDKTLNHTGIIIGPHGGLADTPFAKVAPAEVPVAWHDAAREVSAVTGACLLTRTDLYTELGGFDEKDFGVAFNDVDYCLRVRAAGRRVIYTPQAKLMHWGSATRGVTFDDAEHIAFVRRYPSLKDPYLSSHLRLAGQRLHCTTTNTAPERTRRTGKLRLLLLTHNLNLEGAPLFLLEYATWMAREAGFGLEVLASQDGPLRSAYEASVRTSRSIDTAPLYASPDEDAFHQRLAEIKHRIDWDRHRPRGLQHAGEFLGRATRRPRRQALPASTFTKARRSSASSSASWSSTCTASSPRPFASRPAGPVPLCRHAGLLRGPQRQRQLPAGARAGSTSTRWTRFAPGTPGAELRRKHGLARRRDHHRQHRHGLRAQGPAHLPPRHRAFQPAGSSREIPLRHGRRPPGHLPRPAPARPHAPGPAQRHLHPRDARGVRLLRGRGPVRLHQLRGVLPARRHGGDGLPHARSSRPTSTASRR